MDDTRFDALIRTLARPRAATRSRRQLVARGMAATLLGALVAPGTARALSFCTEQQTGERCRNNGQCCLARCKKKHGKHKGKCRCSALGKPCFDDGDCCGHDPQTASSPVCEFKTGQAVAICCKLMGGSCATSAACCSNLICSGTHICADPV